MTSAGTAYRALSARGRLSVVDGRLRGVHMITVDQPRSKGRSGSHEPKDGTGSHKPDVKIQFMRTAPPMLLPIFRSASQARILAAAFLSTPVELSVQDLAARARTPYATAHRELGQLLEAGLLCERRVGHVRQLRANDQSPFFRPLRDLLETAFGPVPLLRAALEHVAGVEAVAIFGSFAQRLADLPGPPPADVDVLIVGSPDLGTVYDACRQVAREVDRPVNPTVFSLQEWRSDDVFVNQLRSGSLVPILGQQILGNQAELTATAPGLW